jgi:hypothetical protein
MDRIQANYFYFGDEGLATEVLLSTTLDYTYHPGHQDPPTLFVYRNGGKTYFCCEYTGGNEYGGGSFAHYGFVYTEILSSGKAADPVSLEYGHYAGQQWYAAVYEGDERVSFSEISYDDNYDIDEMVSFDAINERLAEVGLLAERSTDYVFADLEGTADIEFVRLKEINEKTPGVTMLVSGTIGGFAEGPWTVDYTDHLRYDNAYFG